MRTDPFAIGREDSRFNKKLQGLFLGTGKFILEILNRLEKLFEFLVSHFNALRPA